MATAAPANGARTGSPAASCGTHCRVLDMKPNDRTIVHSRPQPRTVVSDSIMYRETAFRSGQLKTAPPSGGRTAWHARTAGESPFDVS